MPPRTLAALLGVALLTSACSDDAPGQDGPPRREAVVDAGAEDVVDLRPVRVQAAPGDTVVLRSASPGSGVPDDESPVQHLFVSDGEVVPPLFAAAGGGGVLPNPGVWGICRGGDVAAATSDCPIPPIEGPERYDGEAYFSLGAMVPGESRELPLADDLPLGTYRFLCALHPRLTVDVEVVDDPEPVEAPEPVDAAAARRAAVRTEPAADAPAVPAGTALVRLAPQPDDPPAEVLAAVPAEVRIPVGGTVVWTVPDRSPHTVELGVDSAPHLADTQAADTVPLVPAGGAWDGTGEVRSGVLSTDVGVARREFRLRFTRAGTYTAYDRFHVQVVTTVRVG